MLRTWIRKWLGIEKNPEEIDALVYKHLKTLVACVVTGDDCPAWKIADLHYALKHAAEDSARAAVDGRAENHFKAIKEEFASEKFIDSVVDRINRKQLGK